MATHPYKHAPATAFWSRSVSSHWNPANLLHSGNHLIRKNDAVVSAGSCFAANIAPYLKSSGLNYLKTEKAHPIFATKMGEKFGYSDYSAAYGNVYTARQLLQLLRRSLGTFKPSEDRWYNNSCVIDPFRPGLRYPARSDQEFDVLTRQHLARTREAFEKADVFIFTFGLTEAWSSRADGAVFPACPGTIAGEFDDKIHAFKNFTVEETVSDFCEFISLLRQNNTDVRIILTISPVPLVATATSDHVLSATIYSKSVLRVAAQEISRQLKDVVYFPAYEIITGPQAPTEFFSEDRRHVSEMGVDAVMRALLQHCEIMPDHSEAPGKTEQADSKIGEISQRIGEYECEEHALDQFSSQ